MDAAERIRYLRTEIENAAYIEDKLDRYARRETDPKRHALVQTDLLKLRNTIERWERELGELKRQEEFHELTLTANQTAAV